MPMTVEFVIHRFRTNAKPDETLGVVAADSILPLMNDPHMRKLIDASNIGLSLSGSLMGTSMARTVQPCG